MNCEVKKEENYAVVSIKTEKFDAAVAPEVKSTLVLLSNEKFKNIIMDLSGARYCDSSALSAILVANRLCKEAKGTFVLCGANATIEKLINISQLDTILNITPTLSEAVDFLFMEELEKDLGEEEEGNEK